MRIFRGICLMLALWPGGAVLGQDALVDVAQQANALAAQGQFETARSLYLDLIDRGVRDSVVFYNLGQIYLELEDSGRALLNFRRAQEIAPRDRDINSALSRVRGGRVDIQGDEGAIADNLAALTSTVLTVSELGWLTLGLWTLFWAVVGLRIVHTDWRGALRGPLIVLAALGVIGLLLWGSRSYSAQFRAAGVVIEPVVPVFSGPDDDYLKIYDLHAAAELRILETRMDWLRFVLPDERQGWIHRDYVEMV